jgi:hypothetical protein
VFEHRGDQYVEERDAVPVLQMLTTMRPPGLSTRTVSRAACSGSVKIWKPNELTTASNVASGRSSFEQSMERNSTPEIPRSSAVRRASSIIRSERSTPTTRPCAPTERAMVIAGSPGPVARSSTDSPGRGARKATRSDRNGAMTRIRSTYESAVSFHDDRVYSR